MIEFNILGLEMHVYTWVNVNSNLVECHYLFDFGIFSFY